jgi:hypothetical protein
MQPQKTAMDTTALAKPKGSKVLLILGGICLAIPFATFPIVIIIALLTNRFVAVGSLVTISFAFFPAGMALLFIAALTHESKRKAAIESFAVANHLQGVTPAALLQLVPPSLKDIGRGGRAEAGYVGQLSGRPVTFFEFSYTVGSGKNSHTVKVSIVSFHTKKSYPHLFLDGAVNGANAAFDTSQGISLEGDFDKYFQLYAPQEGKVAALAVLSPDVMQTLIKTARRFDVEIEDTTITLITSDSIFTPGGIAQIEAVVGAITKEFDHRDISWQPVMDAHNKPMVLQKRRLSWITLVFIVLFILFHLYTTFVGFR